MSTTESLDYMQRKALRRISRGQSISRTSMADPLIRKCYTVTRIDAPAPDLNIVEWCDWVARAVPPRMHLTEYGTRMLASIEQAR